MVFRAPQPTHEKRNEKVCPPVTDPCCAIGDSRHAAARHSAGQKDQWEQEHAISNGSGRVKHLGRTGLTITRPSAVKLEKWLSCAPTARLAPAHDSRRGAPGRCTPRQCRSC